jgi:hypothetical protein
VDRIAAVVDARYVNTGSTDVRGVDFTVGYTVQRGADSFSVNANGTWLIAWRQQVTPTSIAIDQRNRAGQPVDFKGRMTAGWQHGGFDALAGLNYVNAYRNILTGAPIRSWTTFDARIAWTAPNDSWLRGTTIALAAQNIFDSDPPFYDPPLALAMTRPTAMRRDASFRCNSPSAGNPLCSDARRGSALSPSFCSCPAWRRLGPIQSKTCFIARILAA